MAIENAPEKKGRPQATIRQMEIDDLAAVFHLGEELFTSEELPILYRTWDSYEVTGAFTEDSDYCFIAETEGKVVGFILGTTIEKEGTAWKKYGYVSWIGVAEAFQGINLGKRLYRKLESKLRSAGVRMMMADTEAQNEEAIKFFRAIGFSLRGQHVWLTKTFRRPARKAAKKTHAPSSVNELHEPQ